MNASQIGARYRYDVLAYTTLSSITLLTFPPDLLVRTVYYLLYVIIIIVITFYYYRLTAKSYIVIVGLGAQMLYNIYIDNNHARH